APTDMAFLPCRSEPCRSDLSNSSLAKVVMSRIRRMPPWVIPRLISPCGGKSNAPARCVLCAALGTCPRLAVGAGTLATRGGDPYWREWRKAPRSQYYGDHQTNGRPRHD